MTHTLTPLFLNIGEEHCFHDGNRVAIVCEVEGCSDDEPFVPTVAEVWPCNDNEDIRLGHLFAAAPDLLAALEAVMGWYDSGTIARTMRDVGETAAHDKTVREARAAIARARKE